jgi:hypothetical protein
MVIIAEKVYIGTSLFEWFCWNKVVPTDSSEQACSNACLLHIGTWLLIAVHGTSEWRRDSLFVTHTLWCSIRAPSASVSPHWLEIEGLRLSRAKTRVPSQSAKCQCVPLLVVIQGFVAKVIEPGYSQLSLLLVGGPNVLVRPLLLPISVSPYGWQRGRKHLESVCLFPTKCGPLPPFPVTARATIV